MLLKFRVTPQMTNSYGSISNGAYTTLVTESASYALKTKNRKDSVLENINMYFLKPIQLDAEVFIHPQILDISRKSAKVDIEVMENNQIIGKAMLTFQLLDR